MPGQDMRIAFVKQPTALTHSVFPPMYDKKGDFTDSATPDKRGAAVGRALMNIARTAGDPQVEKERTILLATRYFLSFHFDKAALVLSDLYENKAITPEKFFDQIAGDIVNKRGVLVALEKQHGFYKTEGRLTLGGLLEPGLKIAMLNGDRSFALHSVKEALMGTLSNGDPDKNPKLLHLATILPQFKLVSKPAAKATFEFQRADLGKIHTCCSTD